MRQIRETTEHLLRVFLEELLFVGLEDEQARLKQNFVAMHEEVVPNTLQLPGVLVTSLGLHDTSIEGYKE